MLFSKTKRLNIHAIDVIERFKENGKNLVWTHLNEMIDWKVPFSWTFLWIFPNSLRKRKIVLHISCHRHSPFDVRIVCCWASRKRSKQKKMRRLRIDKWISELNTTATTNRRWWENCLRCKMVAIGMRLPFFDLSLSRRIFFFCCFGCLVFDSFEVKLKNSSASSSFVRSFPSLVASCSLPFSLSLSLPLEIENNNKKKKKQIATFNAHKKCYNFAEAGQMHQN